MWMSKCCCLLYLNSYCVYTSLYMHALPFPCTYKNTCHLSELSEHCMSHSARFKNTINNRASRDFKESTNLKGSCIDALKQRFCRKRIQSFPVAILFSENACLLNPRSWPGWDKHLVNSTAPSGQHVVKCVLNPRYLPPCRGGQGFNWLMHSLFDSITKAFYLR